MTSALAIRTDGLSKKFLLDLSTERKKTRSSLLDFVSQPLQLVKMLSGDAHHLWALKNLSVEIKRGECVALMGPNGAGKSTLLKLISRITEPSTGKIDVWGSVGSLLETGVGFHSELTGRENIFLSGAILGLKQKKIKESFDEIVDFSGLEEFIDEPVRHYSSGMRARLGFSVMAIQPHDTLLLDEVLTVGDLAFRHKSKKKIKQLKKEGRTLVVVSHNLDTTNDLCDSAIYINSGQLRGHGPMSDVLPMYLNDVFEVTESKLAESERARNVDIQICDAKVIAPNRETNTPLQFHLKSITGEQFGRRQVRVGVRLRDDSENLVASGISYAKISVSSNQEFKSVVQIPSLPLSAGFYTAQLSLYEEVDESLEELYRINIRNTFPVLPNPSAPAWLRDTELRGVVINEIEFEEVES
jgi:ABC-type polysaccharide/polyol phosphate transport system, ATPase component